MFERDTPIRKEDDFREASGLTARAEERVLRALRRRGELSPARTAARALSVLARDVRRTLWDKLRDLGWLNPAARIPFDAFEAPDCPFRLKGERLATVKLAVFGPPGQGVPGASKRREAIYQQRCAEIMREVRDLESLSYAAARALGHPEVNADPELQSMLRSFISEREAELRARAPITSSASDQSRQNRHDAAEMQQPLRERVHGTLTKLRIELEGHLTNYNEAGAAEVLVRIHDLRKRFPGHVELATVERCEEQVKRLAQKRNEFREQLGVLAKQAVDAIQKGDAKTAAWVLRRLSAINALLPAVLAENQLKEFREQILQCEQHEERREAARNLVERERTVGAEIKRLGAVIHRYHTLSNKNSTDPAVLAKSREEYMAAVEEARAFDDDWLADLMIELDCLLEDLHGPRERAEAQVDQFVSNVRSALKHMREEIREIQNERAASSKRA